MASVKSQDIFHILLASQSPRRATLLKEAGFHFSVEISDSVEQMPCCQTVREAVVENARLKAHDVLKKHGLSLRKGKNTVLIAADTLVVKGERVFGKPQNHAEARNMLQDLALVPHEVLTGVYMRWLEQNREYAGFTRTLVTLISMNNQQLDDLFERSNPLDKAAGYGYQDAPEIVQTLQGSSTNVIGLPMETVCSILTKWLPEAVAEESKRQL